MLDFIDYELPNNGPGRCNKNGVSLLSALNVAMMARWPALCVLLAPAGMRAADLYIATNGAPSGAGTIAQPYDLTTALSGQVSEPGDTFWLRRGNYVIGHIDTRIEGAPGQPITFRQMPGERARVDGSISFFDSMGHVVLRDFELYGSDTNRASSQAGVEFNVTDIKIIPGIAAYSPNLSFINLLLHDHSRHGIYISRMSSNNLVYGCVIYNNGWISRDNAEGHGIHVQGGNGTNEISDNIVFNNSGANMHIYEDEIEQRLAGVTLNGNLAFNAGAIQNIRAYRDWIVGVDFPADAADMIVFQRNMGYYSPGSPTYPDVQIGRDGTNGAIVLTDNYMRLGLKFSNWRKATVSGNVFGSGETDYLVDLNQSLTSLEADWNGNTYLTAPIGSDFIWNSQRYDFSEWQTATGFDRTNSYLRAMPTTTRVFLRANQYEDKRANIIVYNWRNQDSVAVDISSVLPLGEGYEVRNGQDFLAPPVLSGVFDGQPMKLPMGALRVAAPNGPFKTPPPTGPIFNVFVLLPTSKKLGILKVNDTIKLFWPTNCGPCVLQSTDGLSASNEWRDVPAEPAMEGNQYVVTTQATETTAYYRLRTE